ncbi:hypothetical protein C0J52_02586 [Blattella germanica]|nr:hypothetical protein C0J52_02586 [Blattella germanica]
MISSVKERKENAHKFSFCYEDICKLQNRVPLPCVKAHLKKNILDFNCDRVTYDEWGPILNAISLDRSLDFIGIRSTHCGKTVLEEVISESQTRILERTPVIQTRFVLLLLMKSLRMCMSNSQTLTCMELEGLPLTRDYLCEFLEGVKSAVMLQNISLHRSAIGDEGCNMVCQTIKQLSNIISIDMSSCGLTHQAAVALADVIKYQKIHRHSESWKHTLRYREPDLDSLPGLRRLTLNHNTKIRDQGLLCLVDVIKDDIFLKAKSISIRYSVTYKYWYIFQYHWIAVDRFQVPQTRTSRPRTTQTTKSHRTNSTEAMFQTKSSKSDSPISIRRNEHASMSPGTPRTVQFQEPFPPYHVKEKPQKSPSTVQLERAKQQIIWLSQQLSAHVTKCRDLEEENHLLKKQLSEYPGEDKMVMRRTTVQEMERSLAEFSVLMQRLRDLGLDPAAPHILTRKSHSEHATRHTKRHHDKHRVSKSACAMGMYNAVQVEAGVGDAMRKDSSEGTAGTLTYLDCTSDSNGASCEDSDTQERNMADTHSLLYKTVLHKNRELSYLTEDDAY